MVDSIHSTGLLPTVDAAKTAARLGLLTRDRIRQALSLPLVGAYCRMCDQHRTLQPRPWIETIDGLHRRFVVRPIGKRFRPPATYVYACVVCGHPELSLMVGAAADGYVYEYARLAAAYGRDALERRQDENDNNLRRPAQPDRAAEPH